MGPNTSFSWANGLPIPGGSSCESSCYCRGRQAIAAMCPWLKVDGSRRAADEMFQGCMPAESAKSLQGAKAGGVINPFPHTRRWVLSPLSPPTSSVRRGGKPRRDVVGWLGRFRCCHAGSSAVIRSSRNGRPNQSRTLVISRFGCLPCRPLRDGGAAVGPVTAPKKAEDREATTFRGFAAWRWRQNEVWVARVGQLREERWQRGALARTRVPVACRPASRHRQTARSQAAPPADGKTWAADKGNGRCSGLIRSRAVQACATACAAS
jgi:hypothetical protein